MPKSQYGHAHRKMRREWDARVQADEVDCWRCGEHIEPGTPWDLGHDDIEPTEYRGPEHQHCNRAVAGRQPNQPPKRRGRAGSRRLRLCEICAAAYSPNHAAQRTCSRACGAELRRRNQPPASTPPKVCRIYFIECEDCAALFSTRSKASRYCPPHRYRYPSLADRVTPCQGCNVPMQYKTRKPERCEHCRRVLARAYRREQRRKFGRGKCVDCGGPRYGKARCIACHDAFANGGGVLHAPAA